MVIECYLLSEPMLMEWYLLLEVTESTCLVYD